MFRVIILATVIPAIFATSGIETCRGWNTLPESVIVHGCDAAPCEVLLGDSARMSMTFTATREHTILTPRVHAFLSIIGLPYALPDHLQIGCNFIDGASCPVQSGTRFVYNFEFPVDPTYPQVPSLPIEMTMHDQQGSIFCARIRIRTVRA